MLPDNIKRISINKKNKDLKYILENSKFRDRIDIIKND